MAETHNRYRPDIDGLRAVAVTVVIGFHVFPDIVMSGFVGVDIFFVISGFLITQVIITDLQNNSFRFSRFYGRRIRRIFPALLVVLIVSYAFGWFALLADEFKQLGKHIATSAGFLSNFAFLGESGYFDNVSETKPLLHLWSLSIEEQFYIFWPFFLWIIYKVRRYALAITLVVAVASFIMNVIYTAFNPIAAFYLPQTRFWQLLLGSVLAWTLIHPPVTCADRSIMREILFKRVCGVNVRDMIVRNIFSIIGAILIVISALFIPRDSFPGWWAVIPTLGAAFLIMAGTKAWFNRCVLSNRALIWIGLISYPLYLWHWPIFSFIRIIKSNTPSYQTRILVVLSSILLAWLTYTFIEKPIRCGVKRRRTVPILIVLTIVIGYIGYDSYNRNGIRSRVQTRILHPISTMHVDENYSTQRKFNGFFSVKPISGRDYLLERIRGSSRPTVAFLGDSHANRLFLGVEQFSTFNILNIGRGTCPPFINVDVEYEDGKKLFCQPLVNRYLRYVRDRTDIDIILLAAHYSQYDQAYSLLSEGKRLSVAEALNNTISFLSSAQKPIVIIVDVPEVPLKCYQENSERSLPVWSNIFDVEHCTIPRESYVKNAGDFKARLTNTFSRMFIFSPFDSLCNRSICGEIDKDNYLYKYDGHHLNDFGIRDPAITLSDYLDRLIDQTMGASMKDVR